MVTKKDDILKAGKKKEGNPALTINKLAEFANQPQSINMYALATLDPGGEIAYHVHNGECEFYYILSGVGTYNDNGNVVEVVSGDFTFTADGEGHSIKNNGNETLKFIPLIVKY